MHPAVDRWICGEVVALGLQQAAVLDVGGLDVNGTPRRHFAGLYVAVDQRDGPGVDMVCDGESLPYDDAHWDVVISTETLEHCRRPWIVLAEMARVSRKWVLVTVRGLDARGAAAPHDHPGDYWRPTADGLAVIAADAGLADWTITPDPEGPGGLFMRASRRHGGVLRSPPNTSE